jgi:hypothetical protein
MKWQTYSVSLPMIFRKYQAADQFTALGGSIANEETCEGWYSVDCIVGVCKELELWDPSPWESLRRLRTL